ncbi:hypothetical protein GCM10023328_22350 [Modestobacter marinus]|uniref:Secreted protein n=1 Tax=Modestobacter marinus TaxID=477641 RepID=A0A846LUN4_9ACTN|nr:hypothetical protein [Modestobacter marinus]NIH70114.1 hypothetical protein [Modestobacter marinus]GGL84071.1 hypothetical protein GCM10011589_45670 [Modestobacter marinus]
MLRIVSRSAVVLSAITLVLIGGTSAAGATTHEPAATQAASAQRVHAAGAFTAAIDFSSLETRDVSTSTCLFQVEGTLTFTGTLDGVASGTTTALIDAPCLEALSSPPGTFRDVFRFDGDFTGTVDGVPATGDLRYAGITRPGGAIDATIILRAEQARAQLRTVDAQVGVGGTYRGVAVTKG